MPQCIGSQRVGHDLAIEQQQQEENEAHWYFPGGPGVKIP